jgi:hypothetical protein
MTAKPLSVLIVPLLGLVVLTASSNEGDQKELISYQVEEVKGKLVREDPTPEIKLQPGDSPTSGQLLRTGWRASAVISVPEAGAHFTLGSRTRVRLAADRPGVLLEVEKGRLRGLFDRLDGEPPRERTVVTPSAIMAVRGTEYGVAVSKSGDTEVVVFSGVVEVTDRKMQGAPVKVNKGEFCVIQRGQIPSQPMTHHMNRGSWDQGHMPSSMGGHGSGSSMGNHSSGHTSGGAMRHGG